MKGYIFITSSGYDPELGRQIKDPYLGPNPSLGACMPNIRKMVDQGDHIFVTTGKVPRTNQFVLGGFEVVEKISAVSAYWRFPQQRLQETEDRQLLGNVIVDADGAQHHLDNHRGFEERIQNYVVGRNPIALSRADEIRRARVETLPFLAEMFGRAPNASPGYIGWRWRRMDHRQIEEMKDWLESLKVAA